MEEVFKDVPDYEGSYQVSDFGRVKSLERDVFIKRYSIFRTIKEIILKPPLGGNGYYTVALYKDSKQKTFRISTLVAMAFLDHKPDGHKVIVDHKDNIRTNDHKSNLQLITNRKNTSKDRFRGNYTSKYVGVGWDKHANKWKSQITINGKSIHLGNFNLEEEASKEYQKALRDVT